jgi:uncharacterized membrane protein
VNPQAKASLLWGLVGTFIFLVGIQTFRLLTDEPIAFGVAAGVALAVGVAATVATYLLEQRLMRGKEQS